jgi:hypothetical protein
MRTKFDIYVFIIADGIQFVVSLYDISWLMWWLWNFFIVHPLIIGFLGSKEMHSHARAW